MEMLGQCIGSAVDWNQFVNGDIFALVLCLSIGGPVSVIAIVARHWKQVRVAESEAGLKMRMIERGFSAEQIDPVLRAGLVARQHNRKHRTHAAQACCTPDFVMGNAPER